MELRYAEHAPAPALTMAVRCYWTISGTVSPAAAVPNRVLPDNCIDVIFDLRPAGAAQPFVVAPMLTAEVFVHRHALETLGVRFRPGAATEFMDVKASDLMSWHVSVSEVWRDAPMLLERLQARERSP